MSTTNLSAGKPPHAVGAVRESVLKDGLPTVSRNNGPHNLTAPGLYHFTAPLGNLASGDSVNNSAFAERRPTEAVCLIEQYLGKVRLPVRSLS